MSPKEQPSKFDDYVEDYRALHLSSVASSGEDPEYFARYKLDCLRRLGVSGPVLDYGCGIGNLTTHLVGVFPDVCGVDPSSASLAVARSRAPRARFFSPDDEIPRDHFGTAVLAGVLHHVPLSERGSVLRQVFAHLRPGGRLVIFEHNPMNPLTQKAVRDCPFDDDAVLLWPGELKRRVENAGFVDVRLDYIVFFPRVLRALRPLEPHLKRVLLGAQTMTVAARPG